MKQAGLKTARQCFEYTSSGETHKGENLYAILHAPRGDATEAIVLVGAWRNMDNKLNRSGVALVLTLARYFKRWSLWSKDIIFLISPDSRAGPQAWVDAYHDAHSPPKVASLPLKSGALQGAIAIDHPFDHRFRSLHIVYDGVNGQLPNLDLFNTITAIASDQMRIGVSIQKMWQHKDSYQERLQTMLRGMMQQGLGHASGPHSSFIPYHVDAVTLQPFGDGWEDEMAMGRVIESTFRSLNNILEHLHQSFFFYLLIESRRFVSIGTYLPSAMLVATSFTVMAIYFWIQSGRKEKTKEDKTKPAAIEEKKELKAVQAGDAKALVPAEALQSEERQLLFPMVTVAAFQFLGTIPLYLFNLLPAAVSPLRSLQSIMNYANPSQALPNAFSIFTIANTALPVITSITLTNHLKPTRQHYLLMKCFSLLLLGAVLSSLATMNFSLALFIGLLASPLLYVRPLAHRPALMGLYAILLNVLAPTAVLSAGSAYWRVGVKEILKEAAFGWEVSGLMTMVVVWCVWWPAWLMGNVVLLGKVEG